jgi:hypothetical protein
MERIVCVLLALVMCLGLCACATTQIVDGEEIKIVDYRFGIIEELDLGNYIVYDIQTKVVFYIETAGHGGYFTPYQIYQDGVIYGAVYENGEIVPVPYAMGITIDMLEFASKFLE